MNQESSSYPCIYEGCGKVFGSKYNLQRHEQSCHLYIKRFECGICGLKLSSKQSLSEHLYTHSGEKPFVCQVPGCTKRYRQSSQLSVHKRKHCNTARQARPDDLLFPLPKVSTQRAVQQGTVKLPLHQALLSLKITIEDR